MKSFRVGIALLTLALPVALAACPQVTDDTDVQGNAGSSGGGNGGNSGGAAGSSNGGSAGSSANGGSAGSSNGGSGGATSNAGSGGGGSGGAAAGAKGGATAGASGGASGGATAGAAGSGSGGAAGAAAAPTYNGAIKAIYMAKCSTCHTTGGAGGVNFGANYADTQKASGHCTGKKVGECTLVRIKAGEMPDGKGCSGNPTTDAAKTACLTQAQQDAIDQWIKGGMKEM